MQLARVEAIHKCSLIHRDVKPDNFLIGLGNKSSLIYIIDFGLAKRYINPKTNKHIPYKSDKVLTGTARYASLNTHMGIEQSRRDDIEAIGYVLLYFINGSLPWQGLVTKDKDDKYKKIMQCKMYTSIDNLCKGVPNELLILLKYARALKFEEDPDYGYLRGLLKNALDGFQDDGSPFDWSIQDTSVERNRTFMHLIASQNQLVRRNSTMVIYPVNEKVDQAFENKKANEMGIKSPQGNTKNNLIIEKFTPKMRIEGIGITNEMFNK